MASGLAPTGSTRAARSRKRRGLTPDVDLKVNRQTASVTEDDDGIPTNAADDNEVHDERGNLIKIEHADGSITISTDGAPLRSAEADDTNWYSNLVDKIGDVEKGRIADDLMRGIEDDLNSRQEWIDMREEGISLLGLTLDKPDDSGGSPDGLAVEGMSTVRHPMLLEAVLRFQANARSELLPTDGPVKIRNDDNNTPRGEDELAQALEKDFNHFLTVTDKSYYTDTDRMLLLLGFGGTTFKKVYFDPLTNRPASVSVDPDDLIVNNNAITLADAKRITHRSMMGQGLVKRMQLLGIYDDVDLGTPGPPTQDNLRRKKKEADGLSEGLSRPEDRDHEIYECYCELDIIGFEHRWKGKNSGLPVPYVVTLDKTSRKLLAVSRNYERPKKGKLPERRDVFIDFHFVPGLGFYGIGLLHILGNAAVAVTAAWREMLDAGMFASFPGFLYAKGGARQNTNIFRIPPGGGAEIDTMGMKIQDAIMPLPYKTEGLAALMTLAKDIVETSSKVGMTAESNVGEGKQNAPVGTTLALIEQAEKVLNSVHKRLHASQAREFQLLADVFRMHPEAFWETNKKPALPWDEKTFRDALDNFYLVPQADPNTASQTQRIAKVGALFLLAQGAPNLYDMKALHELAIHTLGWGNAQEFFKPDGEQSQPTAEQASEIAELQIKQALADAKKMEAQTGAKKVDGDLSLGHAKLNLAQQTGDVDDKVKIVKTKMDAALKSQEMDLKRQEGITAEKMNLIDAAQTLAVHPEAAHLVAPLIGPAFADVKSEEAQLKANRHGLGGANIPGGDGGA
jgi:hypothetical protein